MSKRELPASIRTFVDAQITVDVERIRDVAGPVVFPYSEYWRRAIAGLLLSGRIKPKNDAAPNRTGQDAITQAMYLCDWAYGTTYRKRDWIYVSDVAQVMLGLQRPPRAEPAVTEFRVLPNLCIFAGSDLPPEKLVPLFRCCKIKRIDRVLEFQLNPRQLAETPSNGKSPGELLADVLKELEPLPATVANVLGAKSTTGEVRIRGCSAIVKPESPEVLDAIRIHGRLKGYLEAGAPPGYLLIKSHSNPHNFVQRCQESGFTVKTL